MKLSDDLSFLSGIFIGNVSSITIINKSRDKNSSKNNN